MELESFGPFQEFEAKGIGLHKQNNKAWTKRGTPSLLPSSNNLEFSWMGFPKIPYALKIEKCLKIYSKT